MLRRAPTSFGQGAGNRNDVLRAGHRVRGPQILVSMPSKAPVTSNELAVLFRASPM